MPTTIDRSALVRQMNDLTWDEVETAISALRGIDGAGPALVALEGWQTDGSRSGLRTAEQRLAKMLDRRVLQRQEAEDVADALVRIGRAMAFRQISFRLQ